MNIYSYSDYVIVLINKGYSEEDAEIIAQRKFYIADEEGDEDDEE